MKVNIPSQREQVADVSEIKPLDGAPFMSDNCWNEVLSVVMKQQEPGKIRCLEWGSGNSTISLVRTGIRLNKAFELVSIDHDTKFYPWLAAAIISEFKDTDPVEVSWHPLEGPRIPLSHLRKVLAERRSLACASLTWQVLLNSKRLQYIGATSPSFNLWPGKLLKQLVKLGLVELSYWLWIFRGLVRDIVSKAKHDQRYRLSALPLIQPHGAGGSEEFFKHFRKNPVAGCLRVQAGEVSVELWHIPQLKTVLKEVGLLLDGPITQLSDYVNVPLSGKFNVVFIDGRARVSCIKRVHQDQLVKKDGYLFVHDAYRSEMIEGFRLFNSTCAFISGSNNRINGKKLCVERSGFPLVDIGDSIESMQPRVVQELFVYKVS